MVVVIPAVEAGAITFTCPLEVSVGEIPPFLWVAHGLSMLWHPIVEQAYQRQENSRDVVHLSHFSSQKVLATNNPVQCWKGRLVFPEKTNQSLAS